jgi:hypothetical protein
MPRIFPEFLQETKGRKWKIHSTPLEKMISKGIIPHADTVGRKAHIPSDNSDTARAIRAHEMSHISHSPRKSPADWAKEIGVGVNTILSVEDCRVNNILQNLGIDIKDMIDEHISKTLLMRRSSEVEEHIVGEESRDATLRFVAFSVYNTPLFEHFKKFVSPEVLVDFKNAYKALATYTPETEPIIPAGDNFEQCCKMLDKHFKGSPAMIVNGILICPSSYGAGEKEKARLAKGKGKLRTGRDIEWGTMDIITVDLHIPKSVGLVTPGPSGSDYGDNPAFIHRTLTDGKIFRRKKKNRIGGTILIDNSGSMGLHPEQIYRLVDLAPYCKIATYNGFEESGDLVIIADHGRISDPKNFHSRGGMNVIDGPALLWLAEQKKPRIWVSDGCVTGVYDHTSERLEKEAEDIISRNMITRYSNIPRTISYFEKLSAKITRRTL